MNMNPFLKPAEGYSHQNEFEFVRNDNTNLLELDQGAHNRYISPVRPQHFSYLV